MRKELTKAEMDVMKVVWRNGKTTVHEILEEMAEPKPAYNTVATVLKVLEKKGFVAREASLKTHEFWPKVPRKDYTAQVMDGVLGDFFGGSVVQMVSFFAEKEDISTKDFDQIMGILRGAKTDAAEGLARVEASRFDGGRVDTSRFDGGRAGDEKPKKARLWIR